MNIMLDILKNKSKSPFSPKKQLKKQLVKEQLVEFGKKSCELKNARRDWIIYGNRNMRYFQTL